MVKKLSSLLVRDNIVSIEKMEEALQRQVIFGGRLGTNLLEMGVIAEKELSAYLATARELNPADDQLYRSVDPSALELLDINAVEHLGVLPVKLHPDGRTDAVVLDGLSGDQLEQLQARTGFHFIQHIIPEFRFHQLLQRFFNRPCSSRTLRLLERFPQVIEATSPSGIRPGGSKPAPPSTRPKSSASARREITLGLGWTLEEVSAYLRDCYVRDVILAVLLGFAGGFARRRMILVVQRQRLQGYAAAGEDIPGDELRKVRLRIHHDGAIERVCRGDTYYQGPPEDGGLHPLFENLELASPGNCLLLPVPVGPRAALVLLMDHGSQSFDTADLEPLFMIINDVSEALERIIRLTKAGTLPPEELRLPPLPERFQRTDRQRSPELEPADKPAPEAVATSAPPQPSQPAAADPPQDFDTSNLVDAIAEAMSAPVKALQDEEETAAAHAPEPPTARPTQALNWDELNDMLEEDGAAAQPMAEPAPVEPEPNPSEAQHTAASNEATNPVLQPVERPTQQVRVIQPQDLSPQTGDDTHEHGRVRESGDDIPLPTAEGHSVIESPDIVSVPVAAFAEEGMNLSPSQDSHEPPSEAPVEGKTSRPTLMEIPKLTQEILDHAEAQALKEELVSSDTDALGDDLLTDGWDLPDLFDSPPDLNFEVKAAPRSTQKLASVSLLQLHNPLEEDVEDMPPSVVEETPEEEEPHSAAAPTTQSAAEALDPQASGQAAATVQMTAPDIDAMLAPADAEPQASIESLSSAELDNLSEDDAQPQQEDAEDEQFDAVQAEAAAAHSADEDASVQVEDAEPQAADETPEAPPEPEEEAAAEPDDAPRALPQERQDYVVEEPPSDQPVLTIEPTAQDTEDGGRELFFDFGPADEGLPAAQQPEDQDHQDVEADEASDEPEAPIEPEEDASKDAAAEEDGSKNIEQEDTASQDNSVQAIEDGEPDADEVVADEVVDSDDEAEQASEDEVEAPGDANEEASLTGEEASAEDAEPPMDDDLAQVPALEPVADEEGAVPEDVLPADSLASLGLSADMLSFENDVVDLSAVQQEDINSLSWSAPDLSELPDASKAPAQDEEDIDIEQDLAELAQMGMDIADDAGDGKEEEAAPAGALPESFQGDLSWDDDEDSDDVMEVFFEEDGSEDEEGEPAEEAAAVIEQEPEASDDSDTAQSAQDAGEPEAEPEPVVEPEPVAEPVAALDIDLEPVEEPEEDDEPEAVIEGSPIKINPDTPLLDTSTLELEIIRDDLVLDMPLEEQELEEVPSMLAPETQLALDAYRNHVEQLFSLRRLEVEEAKRSLVAVGERALPALLERFPGPLQVDRFAHSPQHMPPIQAHGPLLATLLEMGDLAAPAIVGLMGVPSAEVRFYATFYFARVRYEPMLPALSDRLFDRDNPTRSIARHIMRGYRNAEGYRHVRDELRRNLSHGDNWHIEQAASAAGMLTEPLLIPNLIEVLDVSNRRVVEVALRSLSQITFEDFGYNKRRWMRWWERNASQDRTTWLIEALNHSTREIRILAAQEVRQIPGLLVNYSPDASRRDRLRAQQVVAQFFRSV